ncbi:CotH kinase family protein [Mucilaginibacter calamicampi]|uniref:CotH kinase family protein n=1 Tax=Mucilaginibacter calamicampi TaxID=1302352 RepID=A0ABW2YS68_9SPHI
MRKQLLLLLLIAMCVWSCSKNGPEDKVTPTPTPTAVDSAGFASFKIEAKNNSGKIAADLNCTVTGDSIIAIVPEMTQNNKWVVTFDTKKTGTVVKVNDTLQTSGTTVTDFSRPVIYSLTSATGAVKNYTVKLRVFTGLPVLYLTTTGPVVSKDTYVKGKIDIDPNVDVEQPINHISLQIKGRGNSTWVLFPKKPYRLKFDAKAAFLGMPAAKNWVLLANYDDKTLMRTKIAFEYARRIKSDFAPQSRFVEVVMNGEFLGNYLLTSQVEVQENRVNITELKAASTDITGGYLVEIDSKLDETNWFRTTLKNLPMTIKEPEEITAPQLAYIKDYMNKTEAALYSADWKDPNIGYAKYIDAESFMRWYMVNETVKNQDSWDFSSVFYYKNVNGKLSMGPVWDFDLSGGNCNYSPSQYFIDWYTRNGLWMIRLAQDPAWNFKWRAKWAEERPKATSQIFSDIDYYSKYLQLSAAQNFKKWPTLDQYVWPNVVWLGTYDKEVQYYKAFMTQRVAWMDANINSY